MSRQRWIHGAFISPVMFLPAFLQRQEGLAPGRAGLVTGLVTAGTVVSWPLAGFLSDWMGRRKGIYLFSLFAGLMLGGWSPHS
jgi:MFS family permease